MTAAGDTEPDWLLRWVLVHLCGYSRLQPARFRTGIGHMGGEGEGVVPEVVAAHHGPSRINGHHHRLVLLHP